MTSALNKQGQNRAKHALRASIDVPDTISKSVASAIALCRHAWLQSFLSVERASKIDLSFKGDGLFNAKTDEVLEKMKETCSTATICLSTENTYAYVQASQAIPHTIFFFVLL